MQYDPLFPAWRPILAEEEKALLHHLAAAYPLKQFMSDSRNYEEIAVDFVYTSAKIEGNTYDRIDTDNLLRLGITAGGKKYSDAIMLMNLRDGFSQVMTIDNKVQLDFDYWCNLHKVLMKDLLPLHEQGLVRNSAVYIGATPYKPLVDADRLRTEARFIFSEASRYKEPFEQAIYLHCNFAYLQYFRDGNKRTARLMQTAALAHSDILPLFFLDSLIDQYRRATVNYYETGDYSPYVRFFIQNYKRVVESLLGQPV